MAHSHHGAVPDPLPCWPAAERNKQPIAEQLESLLPSSGLVLEVASATGQHVEFFAKTMPRLEWQPSDYDAEHLVTLEARVRLARLPNLRPPVPLDASSAVWPLNYAEAIYNANMIHISPWEVTVGLFAGAARLLSPEAPLVTYGPYQVDGKHISASNAEFDASLKARDPRWGVRDTADLKRLAAEHGFYLEQAIPMPANNLTLVWRGRTPSGRA